ncbi:MAG TPA: hypothetical protein PK812_09570 [Beijerinckiaceae bacterium]|nr:hypothetical protein [Beijerinckiaceae bacterium]
MKFIAIAIIAGVAGFMGWLWFQPECRGGAVVASETACVSITGFDRAFCASAFARPEEAIRRAGGIFPTRDACLKRHTDCIDVAGTGGFGGYAAKPAGFCLVRGADGGLSRMVPVYRGP